MLNFSEVAVPNEPVDLTALYRAWRRQPADPVACPNCAAALTITDRSARPYAEWYVFTCKTCSFEQTLHIPLAGPQGY
jgi:predicted RNA-binding Zn-ribbon protein involved in translation (DUF1610 family)